jgi:PDZ domain-containing protein
VPLDEVYPPDVSTEQIKAESAAQMEVSQQDAISAALTELGYQVPRSMYVSQVFEDSPAAGKVVATDLVVSVDGVPVNTIEELRAAIAASEGAELTLGVMRNSSEMSLRVTPELNQQTWVVGIGVSYVYEFPVDLQLQLGDVGGPSGGLIFTMGIIDKLTPGSLLGDLHVAGTGTISSDGEVGAIGGVKLKMIAAQNAGADLFVGPRSNCSEIEGSIPSELPDAVVDSLDEALEATAAFRESGQVPSEFLCQNNY